MSFYSQKNYFAPFSILNVWPYSLKGNPTVVQYLQNKSSLLPRFTLPEPAAEGRPATLLVGGNHALHPRLEGDPASLQSQPDIDLHNSSSPDARGEQLRLVVTSDVGPSTRLRRTRRKELTVMAATPELSNDGMLSGSDDDLVDGEYEVEALLDFKFDENVCISSESASEFCPG